MGFSRDAAIVAYKAVGGDEFDAANYLIDQTYMNAIAVDKDKLSKLNNITSSLPKLNNLNYATVSIPSQPNLNAPQTLHPRKPSSTTYSFSELSSFSFTILFK